MQGNTLYSSWADNTVRAWNIDNGECSLTLDSGGSALACTNGVILSGIPPYSASGPSESLGVQLWSKKSGVFSNTQGHNGGVNCVFTTDNMLYTASHDGTSNVYVIPPEPLTGVLEKKGGRSQSLIRVAMWLEKYIVGLQHSNAEICCGVTALEAV